MLATRAYVVAEIAFAVAATAAGYAAVAAVDALDNSYDVSVDDAYYRRAAYDAVTSHMQPHEELIDVELVPQEVHDEHGLFLIDAACVHGESDSGAVSAAYHAYRAAHFSAAAHALPGACSGDRELMLQLDRAWDAMHGAAPSDALDAATRARELDLVFGGDHGGEIDDAARKVVARAVRWRVSHGDRDGAARALDEAHLLGIDITRY